MQNVFLKQCCPYHRDHFLIRYHHGVTVMGCQRHGHVLRTYCHNGINMLPGINIEHLAEIMQLRFILFSEYAY